MKCPKCSNEQVGGSFCSNCGGKLVEKTTIQSTDKQEKINQTSQAPQQIDNQTESKKNMMRSAFEKRQFTTREVKVATYFTVSSLAIVMAMAWIFTFLLKSSTFIKDYTYMLLSSITDIPDHILIQLISQMKVTIWDVLLVAHGGSTQGKILIDGMEPIQFEWKLPVIIASLLLLFLLIMISRFLKKQYSITMKEGVNITLISACLYGLIIMILMLFMNPSYGVTGQFVYQISTQPFMIFVRAFVIVFIASFIGLKLWKIELIQTSAFMRPIFALKPFFIALLLSLLMMGIVIVVMWSLVHPASIFSKPLTTPASLWTLYRTDPLFYMLLPTFLFGELLYSLGSSFTISSAQIGELLQIPQGLRFHTLTGISVLDGQITDENHLRLIGKSTKLVWYSFAFLIVFLYSLHRVKLTNLRAIIIQTIFIGIIFSCLAMAVSFTFTSNSESVAGMIGFPVLMSGFITIVVCGIYFTLRYMLRKKIIVTKEGEQHGNK